jgi:hypothetical protein
MSYYKKYQKYKKKYLDLKGGDLNPNEIFKHISSIGFEFESVHLYPFIFGRNSITSAVEMHTLKPVPRIGVDGTQIIEGNGYIETSIPTKDVIIRISEDKGKSELIDRISPIKNVKNIIITIPKDNIADNYGGEFPFIIDQTERSNKIPHFEFIITFLKTNECNNTIMHYFRRACHFLDRYVNGNRIMEKSIEKIEYYDNDIKRILPLHDDIPHPYISYHSIETTPEPSVYGFVRIRVSDDTIMFRPQMTIGIDYVKFIECLLKINEIFDEEENEIIKKYHSMSIYIIEHVISHIKSSRIPAIEPGKFISGDQLLKYILINEPNMQKFTIEMITWLTLTLYRLSIYRYFMVEEDIHKSYLKDILYFYVRHYYYEIYPLQYYFRPRTNRPDEISGITNLTILFMDRMLYELGEYETKFEEIKTLNLVDYMRRLIYEKYDEIDTIDINSTRFSYDSKTSKLYIEIRHFYKLLNMQYFQTPNIESSISLTTIRQMGNEFVEQTRSSGTEDCISLKSDIEAEADAISALMTGFADLQKKDLPM